MSNFKKHVNEVRKFMEKHEFPVDKDIKLKIPSDLHTGESIFLSDIVSSMFQLAQSLERYCEHNCHTTRAARAQIMLEELAETVEAMVTQNEVDLLDGLADLLFVTLGTAITYGLPIEEAHEEVCKSNLSKDKRNVDTNARIRYKGENYVAPKIKEIIERYRNDKRS